MKRSRISTAIAITWLTVFGASIRKTDAATLPPLTTETGVVAADHAVASKVGAEILASGGNAVDAAIATALALGVVNPSSSGIGGGGFAVVYDAKTKQVYAFDFRETGPAAIRPEHFLREGKVVPDLSSKGGLAVGVPGEVAGLYAMSEALGRRPWAEVVEPARRIAESGFRVSRYLSAAAHAVMERVDPHWRLSRWLTVDAKPLPAGHTIRRRNLARTLRRIADHGAKGFYRGRIAQDIVQTVKAYGGVLTMADLANYRVGRPAPLIGRWKSMKVVTMPLPSSGGIALLQTLGMLDASGVNIVAMGAGSSSAFHVIAELLKHAFADRARFLGAGLDKALVSRLLSPTRLAKLGRRIRGKRVRKHGSYGDRRLGKPGAVRRDGGTSHLCVVDSEGNAVALTTTVNTYFGSLLLTPRTGIVLNNEVDDFAVAVGAPNAYGLVQSSSNLVGPGKRPLSSMTPTLLLDERGVVGCAGGSGGPRIISNTLQVLLNMFVFGMDANAAVSFPRIHHQWLPNHLVVEPEVVMDVRAALRRRGHRVVESSGPTAVQAIKVDSAGRRSAASDPRKGGAPASM